MVNRSMNQVLMRSLNTSFVALLPVASLLFVGSGIMGAVTLRDFALALFVGLLTGAYSSIFVATPILAWLKEREPRYVAMRERAAAQLARDEVATLARLLDTGRPLGAPAGRRRRRRARRSPTHPGPIATRGGPGRGPRRSGPGPAPGRGPARASNAAGASVADGEPRALVPAVSQWGDGPTGDQSRPGWR